jgi:hypothetical protein
MWRTRHKRCSTIRVATVVLAIVMWVVGSATSSTMDTIDGSKSSNPFVYQLELRPTGVLLEERRQRQRRSQRRQQATPKSNSTYDDDVNDNDMMDGELEIPRSWLHPWTRAVYATLHLQLEESFSETYATAVAAYADFCKYRHLSRFERHLRTELEWDLHPHWHGNYSDTPFYNPQVDSDHQQRQIRRELLESMIGGRFDNYQGVPLSQGYGTHYVHLWVGSPIPQRQSVIVDTGSHFTGFPVKGAIHVLCVFVVERSSF